MKKSNSNSSMILGLFSITLILGFFVGWCMNIYKIVQSGFEVAQWGGMEVARCIGVFVAPLGGVLGWF